MDINTLVKEGSCLGFTRKQRLLNQTEFKYVFSKANKSSDACFTVLARYSGRAYARLGLAIAKKQIKRAVDRNLLKRLVRESFRHHQDLLKGYDVVVMARQRALQENPEILKDLLNKHWYRVIKK